MKIWHNLSFLWLIVCSFGCCFQIFQLGSQYLSYEINTNVRLLFKKQVIVASETFCFQTYFMIKWDILRRDAIEKIFDGVIDPQIVFNNNETESGKASLKEITSMDQRTKLVGNFYKQFPLNFIFNNMTYTFKEVFDEEWTMGYRPDSNDYFKGLPFDEYFEVTTFMRDGLKCFTLDIREKYWLMLDFKKIKRQPIASFFLNSVTFTLDLLKKMPYFWYMTDKRGKCSQGGIPAYLSVETKPNVIIGFSYEEYEEVLLPPPFDTMCRKYSVSEDGFISQDHCYESCYKWESLRATRSLLPGILMFANDSASIIPYSDELEEASVTLTETGEKVLMKNLRHNLSEECEKKCWQRDCHVKTFIPRQTSLINRNDELQMTIYYYVSPSPVNQAVFLPQYSWTQFITDIIATCGFWMAFSAFGAASWFRSMAKTFTQPFKPETKQKKINRFVDHTSQRQTSSLTNGQFDWKARLVFQVNQTNISVFKTL